MPGVGLVCEHVCFREGGEGAAAGHRAPSMSVNAAERFTTACGHQGLNTMLNRGLWTRNPPSVPASNNFPPCFTQFPPLSAAHPSSLLTSPSTSFVS